MPVLKTPDAIRPGGRLRDKESGEEFRITHVGYMVFYEGESGNGEVRSDMLEEIFEALPPEVDDTPIQGAFLGDEETTFFEEFAYRDHYRTSMAPMSAQEYLGRDASGHYLVPGLEEMRKAWDAGRACIERPAPKDISSDLSIAGLKAGLSRLAAALSAGGEEEERAWELLKQATSEPDILVKISNFTSQEHGETASRPQG